MLTLKKVNSYLCSLYVLICKWACCNNLVAPTNAILLLYCLSYPLSRDLVKYTTGINTLVFTPNSGADSGRAV